VEQSWAAPATPTADAIAWFRAKVPMTADEFYALEAEARRRAFTVSGVAELDLVSTVWEALERGVREGTTLEDFRKAVGDTLEAEWGGPNPSRLETIFRTNVQSAYSAGRYRQNNSPAVRATHPYSKFSAVMDSRTSDICEALDGTVLPSDDPFWSTHQPPLHFNCRSDVSAITEDEARELGVDDGPPEGGDPDEGFGNVLDDFEPDLSTRPVELAHAYEMKQHLP
jgi:SPP1 gp7 family putative phage head morphogenesis protein